MKSKKLNLNEMKVKSFVTSFEDEKENTVRGGTRNQSLDTRVCTFTPCGSLDTGGTPGCPDNE